MQLLPTAAQDAGIGAGVAGLLAALSGVAVVLAAGVVGRLRAEVRLSRTAAVGAVALAVAGAVVTWQVSAVTVGLSCGLLALTWAFLHNALQTWISEVPVPGRGLVVSCFAGCLFLGSALGAGVAAPWVAQGEWRQLFGTATAAALVLGVVVVVSRLRVERQPS